MRHVRLVLLAGLTMASLVLALLLALPLVGAQALDVVSGSMEPAIPTGSVVVVRPGGDPRVGDVVTFVRPGHRLVTHRVIETNAALVTQGDANSAPDEPIRADMVVGHVWFHLPYLGYLRSTLSDSPWLLFLLLGAAGFELERFLSRRSIRVPSTSKELADA